MFSWRRDFLHVRSFELFLPLPVELKTTGTKNFPMVLIIIARRCSFTDKALKRSPFDRSTSTFLFSPCPNSTAYISSSQQESISSVHRNYGAFELDDSVSHPIHNYQVYSGVPETQVTASNRLTQAHGHFEHDVKIVPKRR